MECSDTIHAQIQSVFSFTPIPGTKILFCEYSISMDRCLARLWHARYPRHMTNEETRENKIILQKWTYDFFLYTQRTTSFKWTLIIGGKWKHVRITNGNNFERRFAEWNVGIYLSVASYVHVVFLFAIKTVMVCGYGRKTCRHTELRDKEVIKNKNTTFNLLKVWSRWPRQMRHRGLDFTIWHFYTGGVFIQGVKWLWLGIGWCHSVHRQSTNHQSEVAWRKCPSQTASHGSYLYLLVST